MGISIQKTSIAFIGSREYNNERLVRQKVLRLNKFDHQIVSGGARGVDSWAENEARQSGIFVRVFKAEWDKYRPKDPSKKNPAGMIRNTDIIRNSDIVIAFWNGKSRGTMDSVRKSLQMRKPVIIYMEDGTYHMLYNDNNKKNAYAFLKEIK